MKFLFPLPHPSLHPLARLRAWHRTPSQKGFSTASMFPVIGARLRTHARHGASARVRVD